MTVDNSFKTRLYDTLRLYEKIPSYYYNENKTAWMLQIQIIRSVREANGTMFNNNIVFRLFNGFYWISRCVKIRRVFLFKPYLMYLSINEVLHRRKQLGSSEYRPVPSHTHSCWKWSTWRRHKCLSFPSH